MSVVTGLYAVSANYVMGYPYRWVWRGRVFDVPEHAYAYFQTLTPVTKAGYSIWLYELSKADCEALTGANVSGFAYPHGDLDDETKSMVRDAGFAWAVSTRSAALDATHHDVFDLPRLQVLNWSGSELMDALASLETGP